jgi:hypothetical protein
MQFSFIPSITFFILILLGLTILLSRKFWISVAGHTVDWIAKQISKIVILFIVLSFVVLIVTLFNK